MGLGLVAGLTAGANLIGGILGGKARKKAALQQNEYAYQVFQNDFNRNEVARAADMAEAQALTASDEARMREAWAEATGYDLEALRDEALRSGFNPLTILQATGAANYARTPAPVLTTPFVPRSIPLEGDYVLQASQGVAQTAGYVGDAISGAAQTFLSGYQAAESLKLEREGLALEREIEQRRAEQTLGLTRTASAAPVRQVVGTPFFDWGDDWPELLSAGMQGPEAPVAVQTMAGWHYINPAAARRLSLKSGDWLTAGDVSELLGDAVGETRNAGEAVFGGNSPYWSFGASDLPPGQLPPAPVPQPELTWWNLLNGP